MEPHSFARGGELDEKFLINQRTDISRCQERFIGKGELQYIGSMWIRHLDIVINNIGK